MKDYLQTFDLVLRVDGPVFIGSGKEITKKEYLFLEDGKKVGVMDIAKLYDITAKKAKRRQFEEFMMSSDTRVRLDQWLQINRLQEKDILPCIKYELDAGDTSIQRGQKAPVQIMQFIRDPYGLPFVPGSSLKGMLRTILLAGRIHISPERYAGEIQQIKRSAGYGGNSKRYLSDEAGAVESRAFRNLNRTDANGKVPKWDDAVNDELSGLIVSDSEPLKVSDLVLCQKIEGHLNGDMMRLNLLRECLRPETMIRAKVTIDSSVCTVTKEEIMQAVQIFDDYYTSCFLDAFRGTGGLTGNQIYLGGGAGFVSKTMIYPLLDKEEGVRMVQRIFEQTKVPEKHGHRQDSSMGVSPHIVKYTRYKGQILEFGKCTLFLD